MLASLARILILITLGFGAYKLYPHYQPLVQKQLDSPNVLGATVDPWINSLNQVLPESIQIPRSSAELNPAESQTSFGDTQSGQKTPEAIQKIFDEVKVKTGEVAQEQLEVIKKEASKQFCSVLLEKIKNECSNL